MTDSLRTVVWKDPKDHELGRGAQTQVQLSPGSVSVRLFEDGIETGRREIFIRPFFLEAGARRTQSVIPGTKWARPAGHVAGVAMNTGTTVLALNLGPTSPVAAHRLARTRDVTLPALAKKELKRKARALVAAPLVGDSQVFRIADLASPQGEFLQVAFMLTAITDDLELWVESGTNAAAPFLFDQDWLSALQTIMRAKLENLWGPWPDIDGNGKVRVLFSPRINASGVAVGFFNPSDLWARTADNPVSNEGEYLYLGTPVSNDPFFSYDSLAATVAHEGFHLIHYNARVLQPFLMTGRQVPEETVPISEGLAHFSEALCGYGHSGGDIAFAERFLRSPGAVSMVSFDADGSSDSVAKRGAWLLFLGYLYSQPEGPVHLREMLRPSDSVGWNRLSEILGQPADTLWQQWLEALALPHTGSSTILTGWEGEMTWGNGTKVGLNGPSVSEFQGNRLFLPKSAVFWSDSKVDMIQVMSPSTLSGSGVLTLTWWGL